jgi:hypothetical protein
MNGLDERGSGRAALVSVFVTVIGEVRPFSLTGILFFIAGAAANANGLALSPTGSELADSDGTTRFFPSNSSLF